LELEFTNLKPNQFTSLGEREGDKELELAVLQGNDWAKHEFLLALSTIYFLPGL
jgi:hypothetical protein